MERIVEKLDRYLEQKDFAAAERHLRYWLSEAAAAGDRRGRLALLNEQIGFYRKQEQKTEALAAAEAAQLACNEFVNAALKVAFLLRDRYLPYYKWSFRALRSLAGTETLAEQLSFLLRGDVSDNGTAKEKYRVIEAAAAETIAALQEQKLTKATCGDLEKHAYSVNDAITDGMIRNLHILTAV